MDNCLCYTYYLYMVIGQTYVLTISLASVSPIYYFDCCVQLFMCTHMNDVKFD